MGGWRRARGFTLLEILVALAILGSTFVILLSAHTAAARKAASARRLMTATLLARQILTDTEVNGTPDLGEDSGEFGEEFPDFAWSRQVTSVAVPIETPVGDLPTDALREVRIRVTWPEAGRTGETEVVYYARAEEP